MFFKKRSNSWLIRCTGCFKPVAIVSVQGAEVAAVPTPKHRHTGNKVIFPTDNLAESGRNLRIWDSGSFLVPARG